MKPADVKNDTYITLAKKLKVKILNLKLVIMREYQNIKAFLLKNVLQIWSEEVFVIEKVKNAVTWTYFINDLNREEIIGIFRQKGAAKNKSKRIYDRKSN